MTLKKAKEIIRSYLEKVKFSPETDPKFQDRTRVFLEIWYKWLEQKVTDAGIKQRWLIVESAELQQSDIQKLNSKIKQEKNPALKNACPSSFRWRLVIFVGFNSILASHRYIVERPTL